MTQPTSVGASHGWPLKRMVEGQHRSAPPGASGQSQPPHVPQEPAQQTESSAPPTIPAIQTGFGRMAHRSVTETTPKAFAWPAHTSTGPSVTLGATKVKTGCWVVNVWKSGRSVTSMPPGGRPLPLRFQVQVSLTLGQSPAEERGWTWMASPDSWTVKTSCDSYS
eukprot:scaffold2581_cov164-Pinguiococcus_pyrenoidosus.AAC.1